MYPFYSHDSFSKSVLKTPYQQPFKSFKGNFSINSGVFIWPAKIAFLNFHIIMLAKHLFNYYEYYRWRNYYNLLVYKHRITSA